MSAPAYTPGPWSYCSCGCGFIGGGDDEVCTVTIGKWGDEGVDIFTGKRELVHHWGTVPPERAHANAHLIAAAPCMAGYVRKRADAGDPEAIELWGRINADS